MGGFFGIVSRRDAIADLFYGTDYHSHLGTKRGGLAVLREDGLRRVIHNIENAQFRSKFDDDLAKMHGPFGDRRHQRHRRPAAPHPLAPWGFRDRDGRDRQERRRARGQRPSGAGGSTSPRWAAASSIRPSSWPRSSTREESFEEGIRIAQDSIDGSCSILLLTEGRHLRRPRQARPDAGHHRQEPRERRRDDGDLRPSQPGLRDLERTWVRGRSSS